MLHCMHREHEGLASDLLTFTLQEQIHYPCLPALPLSPECIVIGQNMQYQQTYPSILLLQHLRRREVEEQAGLPDQSLSSGNSPVA